jgi:membrane-associated phospholipid phosphatase
LPLDNRSLCVSRVGFTLVYSGHHYVFDIVVGWLFAVLVCIGAARHERYRSPSRDVGPALSENPDRDLVTAR